jgi:4-hydroxybenzoate polyprenyltransferase
MSLSSRAVRARLKEYALLLRLHRPIGTLLLLWPVLWALWIAGAGHPSMHVLAVFVAGTILMRSAGCAINDYADRHFDPHVERTRDRPLAAGRVSPREALVLFAVLSLAAFALVLTLDRFTILLSFIGAALAASYPFMKRYTHLPQVVLGIAFSWGIPMAFAAERSALPPTLWLVFCAAVLWSVVYDTFYAMVDREDDLAIGVKSTAILFGDADRLITAVLQALVLLLLWLAGRRFGMGLPYTLALLGGAALFAWQQHLIRERVRERCFRAFLNNNLFGLLVFAGIAVDYLLR